MTDWWLYIVKCKDGTLYTGVATDVDRRLEEHRGEGPKGAKYLRGRGPFELVYHRPIGDRSTALKVEYAVKRMSKADKIRLIEGEDFYFDACGLMVLTEAYLIKRGTCCQSGCRHCPYRFKPNTERLEKKQFT